MGEQRGGEHTWVWWLAPLVAAGLAASPALMRPSADGAAAPRAQGEFWSVRDSGGRVLDLPAAEHGLALLPGQILRIEDPDPARRLTGASVRIEAGARQSGFSDIRFHGTGDAEFRVHLVPAKPLTAFIAQRHGDAPWTRLETGVIAEEPVDPRAAADIALSFAPGAVSVSWNGQPLVRHEGDDVVPPQQLALLFDCALVLGCAAEATRHEDARPEDGGAAPQRWREEFSDVAPRLETARRLESLILTTALLVIAVLWLRSRCPGRPPAGLLARATLLFLAPLSLVSICAWIRPLPPPLLVLTMTALGVCGLSAAVKLLRGTAPAPAAQRDRLRATLVGLGIGAALTVAAARAAGADAERELDLLESASRRLTSGTFQLDGPRELDLSNALQLEGSRRDLDAHARVTLAPDSLLEVRLRIPDGRPDASVALCLSTDDRVGAVFCRESTDAFMPIGSGSGAVPAAVPLDLRIQVQRDRFSAEINGRTVAEATDDEDAVGSMALLAAAGSVRVDELVVTSGDALEGAPSPGRARLRGAGVALALLLALGLLARRALGQPAPAAFEGAAFALVPLALGLAASDGGLLSYAAFAWVASTAALLLLLHAAWLQPAVGPTRVACFVVLGAAAATGALFATTQLVRPPASPERAWIEAFPRPRYVAGLFSFQHAAIRRFNTWLPSHRFRGRSYPVAGAPDGVRILSIGSSSTWGHGIPEESGLDYPTVVEQLLRARLPDLPIEVINGAVRGSSTARMLPFFGEVLLRFSPDVVTLSFFYNDSFLPPQFDEERELARLTDADFVYDAAAAEAEARRAWEGDRKQQQLVDSFKQHGPPTLPLWRAIADDPSAPAAPEFFAAHLRQYAQLCRQAGVRLVLIKEPTRGDDSRLWQQEFYAAMDAVAAEFGLAVVDPRPELAAAPSHGDVFMDDIHPTVAGHALVARAVARTLVPIVSDIAGQTDEHVLSRASDIDKAPRLSGDWVCWTSDAGASGSTGTVVVRRLSTGESWRLGPGFLPDIEAESPAAEAGVPAVRVAWLRLLPDGVLDVCEARPVQVEAADTTWPVTVLAHDLRWADELRVCGDVTVWSAPDADGVLRIFAHDGEHDAVAISREGQAFRPELVRDAQGQIHCVWDAYLQQPDVLDYEIFLSRLGPDGSWSLPRNVSAAPGSLDMAPSAAAGADGSLWLAWQTNRGSPRMQAFVARLLPDGSVLLPAAPPPETTEPAEDETRDPGGTVSIAGLRGAYEPRLVIDGAGRPWLFVNGLTAGSEMATVFNKQLRYLVLDESGWSEPQLVSDGELAEIALDGEAVPGDPLALRVVYQLNSSPLQNVEIVEQTLRRAQAPPAATTARALLPPSGPPLPQIPATMPQLPRLRALEVDGRKYRLLFADLHCHTKYSGDGIGERDQALFFARDLARLDAVAITDHDERVHDPLTDWEFEQGRRFMALFDTPSFAAFMGFEWTNDQVRDGDEIIGHRACFDTRRCYRYTDPAVSSLASLYAVLQSEDAIGVPHHLGKHGGSSFHSFDARVQPVTEVSSLHGEYEAELWAKLLRDGVRFGVTAAGDNHLALPGNHGLAGLWIDAEEADLHAAIKEALRSRRCFGVRRNGLWMDVRLDGKPMGSVLELPAGEPQTLSLDLRLGELPDMARAPRLNVNLVRDGDVAHPVWSHDLEAGQDFAADAVPVPAPDRDAIYMLRVSNGAGSDSADTIAWSSPIWVDVGDTTPDSRR